MGRLFGTDGIRGIVNDNMNSELALRVGLATGSFFREINSKKPKFVIASDTRISKDMLVSSIISGLTASGADVINFGVLPTPALALLTREYKADGGIMITASHNPAKYNGIKIFNGLGYKLNDEVEEEIEDRLLSGETKRFLVNNDNIGKEIELFNAYNDYKNFLFKKSADLSNLKVVLDCANGATSHIASEIMDLVKTDYHVIANNPDGLNINNRCGSTYPENLIETMKNSVTDKNVVGFAFDGDADRCIAVDENREVVDGDEMLAIITNHLKEEGRLDKFGNTLVGTIMSNYGLKQFCVKNGINFVDTKVGDRYVLEKMLLDNYIIGGEQSGHIIFKQHQTTGDGLLTAIIMLNIMRHYNMPLSELKKVMEKYPQSLENIDVTKEGKVKFLNDTNLQSDIEKENSELGTTGRVLVRASGTEDLIRVMAEAKSEEDAKKLTFKYSTRIKQSLNRN